MSTRASRARAKRATLFEIDTPKRWGWLQAAAVFLLAVAVVAGAAVIVYVSLTAPRM